MIAHHILVPTDFSDYADHALDYAIALAKVLKARLTFLHVIHLSPLVMGEMGGAGLVPYLEDIEADAQQRMQALLTRVNQEGLQGETAVVQGVPYGGKSRSALRH